MDTNLYSWVVRGKQRKAVIKVMNKPQIPSEIRKEVKLTLNNTSDVLRAFVKQGIAKVLNPKERVGRLYVLTKEGKAVREAMLKN